MPPEPLPWDRKDLFRETKHERVDALVRWRENGHHGSRVFVRGGSDESRRPVGYGKQGSYRLFPDENGHGCTPSRSEDEIYRPAFISRDGRYPANNKEIKGSFSHKDWRGHQYHHPHHHSWEAADGSANSPARPPHAISTLRSVDPLRHPPHTHSDVEKSPSRDQSHLKNQYDKMGGFDGLGTGHINNKDHSLGSMPWKPLKWTRSGSLSSRSSSMSTKSDFDDGRFDVAAEKETLVESPSGDAGISTKQAGPSDETCPKKKPRLGWGEGLAKYEKKKVEGPEEISGQTGLIQYDNSSKTALSITPGLPDTSPKVASDCASPATPCSVAWSSSPGVEGKPNMKAENDDSISPVHGFQTFPDLLSFKLEKLELYSINNLSSVLLNLIQPEDAGSSDPNCVSAMNKLLPFKSDILKALEKTECEIDMFENELKSLQSEPEMSNPSAIASKFLPAQTVSKCCGEKVDDALNVSWGSAQFEDYAPGCAAALTVREPLLLNTSFEAHSEAKGEAIDSPGTVTSRFGEPLSEKGAFVSDKVKSDEDAAKSASTGGKWFALSVNGKSSAAVSGDEDENCLNRRSIAYHTSGPSLQSEEDFNLNDILACNKISAREASDTFHKVLPTVRPQFDIWGASKSGLCRQNDDQIKKKLALRKHFLRFKERVLTLKFRALHHLWKEDLRLLSFRKYRAKSQKRFEVSSRSSHGGYQKHRSSIRSRFTSPAGNLTLVPTTEIVDFTSRLLSDSQIKLYRNCLKMPALILDEKERRQSKFITSNALVEHPCAIEKEREVINPWTPDEKKIFLEMLAAFGKDFTKIASFLSHKTTADCVEFYYKNQKSEIFENAKKTMKLKKQEGCVPTNYLVTSGKKWNREANAASLDMLGAASVIAACADGRRTQQTYSGMSILGGYYDYKMSCSDDGMLETASSFSILRNEREAAAADVLAGICGALSSEAMGSCITSSVDPGEGCPEWKCQKMNHMMLDRPLTPDVTQTINEEDTCSDESCGELDSVDWTDEEKATFIRALGSYGKDFASISRCIRTRSRDQCKIFFSKARKCLGLDSIRSGPGNEGTPMSDANGGSDTEDACVVEMDSAICSTQSCCKQDVELPDKDAEGHAGNILSNIEMDVVKDENSGENREEGETMIENLVPDVCQGSIKVELVCNVDKEQEGLSDLDMEVLKRDRAAFVNDESCNSSVQLQEATPEMFVDTEAQEHGAAPSVIISRSPPSVIISRSLSTDGPNGHRRSKSHEIEPNTSEEAKLNSLVSKTESDDRLNAKSNLESKNRTNPSGFTPDSNGKGNVSSQTVEDAGIRSGLSFVPGHQHQISLELLPCAQKSQTTTWKQKENCPKPGNSLLPESSAIRSYEEPLRQAIEPTLNFEGHNKQLHKSPADLYQHYLSAQHRVDQTLQIIRSYPLRIGNNNEIDRDADSIGKKPVVLPGVPKIKNSQCNQFFGQHDLYPEKCNGSKLPFRSQSNLDDAEEQSCKTGDVKLFGQVLSHPSSLKQKPNPQNVADDKTTPPKSGKSFSLNFSEHTSGTSIQSPQLESSSYIGMEEFPLRSYGFWDGNRIQTGLSSLPDSAMLLAKYPGAFTDFPPIVKRNDRKSGGVPIFPAKDGSGNGGLGEYQLYRGYERANMQPFKVDVKQRHDVFSELQKRNGFETVSGRGGRTGVSDPVAAIKLHYAAERLGGGQTGIVSREEETWRGGDIGR